MADTIGRISVPSAVASGLVFPLTHTDFGYSTSRPFPIITHRFGELATKAYQRFQVGIGPRRFQFRRAKLSYQNRVALLSFFEAVQGSFQSFQYNVPQSDRVSTIPYQVTFEQQPLSIQELVNACQVGTTFIEEIQPSAAPVYQVSSACLRFPSTGLKSALQSQVQQIIPLVHIRVRESAVADIWLSDRRMTLQDIAGGTVRTAMGWASTTQLYLPRLLNIGEPGSDVLMTQDISGASDNMQFVFGNADRVMTSLANDTDLKYASIDLCLLHVQSQTILQLWKGFVQDFQSDGTSRFTMQCSDGLFQIMQQYPTRVYSRTCWKTYNDGVNCPFSTVGSIIGTGNSSFCDYTYGTDDSGNLISGANGCAQHSMTKYFGGHPAHPQSVRIKDNSTGVFGFGRNTVTATSIVSDTLWGQAMADIWCNTNGNDLNSYIANCIVVDVRDEGDFKEVLGVIGAGPLGAFTIGGASAPTTSGEIVTNTDGLPVLIAPLADGFFAQGFKLNSSGTAPSTNNSLGLREWLGTDPYGPGDQSYGEFGLDQIGGTSGVIPFATGTAFCALRYPKPSGINPSTTEGHSMTVPIAKGLTGFTWNADGSVRTAVSGLTNPFWICVNTLLRALGLNTASSSTQQQYFVLSSLFVGDGTGTAEVADASVPTLVGSGNETRFQYQGTIGQQKPLRDWLTEILNCCLGYYTWEFGKLKLGVRDNASAMSAFTYGNMLFQSLELHPINATFERLVIDFADQAYQFQANTCEYQDKDHAYYYGRSGSPLTARMHSPGICTMSQALRIAGTREREETGGINLNNTFNSATNIDPTEWKHARTCRFRTTILSLETEVGQVISITHPDIPTGSGNFRIKRWTLRKDWSIEIEGQSVTASMYALDVGPKPPPDVLSPPLPVLRYPEPVGQWAPYQIQAPSNDALWPSEWTFDLSQSYAVNADGSAAARVSVTGKLPVNSFIPNCGAPSWSLGAVAISTTGGSLPGGTVLKIEICATNATGLSPNSQVLYVSIPTGTNTNQITVSDIQWPPFAGLTGYEIFYSQYDDLICAQQSGTLTAGSPPTLYTPTSVTITGPISRSTWQVPNSSIRNVRAKVKNLHHGGVVGALVDSVSTGHIISSECIDTAHTDNWAGRALAVIGRDSASVPYVAYSITAFNNTTGDFTVTPNPSGTVLADDVFVVCFKGYDNSASPTVFTDAGISNGTNPTPHTGMVTNAEVGYVLRVIAGKGRGMAANVVSNTSTSWTLDAPITIDSTSVWIIEGRGWEFTQDATPVTNALSTTVASINLPTTNYLMQPVIVCATVISVDASGNVQETDEGDAPFRMGYLFGSTGSIPSAPGWAILVITANAVSPDLAAAKNFKVTLNQSTRVVVNAPVWTGVGSIAAGTLINLYVFQDATGSRPPMDFATSGVFGNDVIAEVPAGDAGTFSVYTMKMQSDSKWHIDSFRTGQTP